MSHAKSIRSLGLLAIALPWQVLPSRKSRDSQIPIELLMAGQGCR